MPRPARGPRPTSSPTEDRKAIEQRARDATAPFEPEKKGQWPFPIEESNDGGGNDRASQVQSGQSNQNHQ
jgi:hypothetical protein